MTHQQRAKAVAEGVACRVSSLLFEVERSPAGAILMAEEIRALLARVVDHATAWGREAAGGGPDLEEGEDARLRSEASKLEARESDDPDTLSKAQAL